MTDGSLDLDRVDLDPDRLDTPEEPAEKPEDDLEEIYRLADEIAEEGGYVRVYRRDDRGKPRYLTRWGADAFDLEDLRRQFGGGSFQIRFHDGEGKYHLQKTVYIEGPPKHPGEEEEEEREEKGRRGEVAARVAQLADDLKEMRRDLQRNAGDFNRAGADPASMLLNMMQVIQKANEPLMTAVLERARERDGDPDSAVDRLLEGIQLGRELGGGPAMPAWERAVQRYLPALKDLSAGAPGASGGAPGPGPAASPAPATEEANVPPYRWYPFLAPHLRKLVSWADAGKDPQLRAWVWLEDIPESYYATIFDELSRPGFRDELYTIQGLPERRAWMDAFLETVLEELSPDVSDGDGAAGAAVSLHDPAGGRGDVGDASDDGGGGEEGGG